MSCTTVEIGKPIAENDELLVLSMAFVVGGVVRRFGFVTSV